MRAADGGPDQPQASSQFRIRPERQELSPAVAANRVSGPRTQPWKVRRKPGSQPKVRPGTVAAADLSPWPRARRLLYVPEAEGTNPALPTTCSRDRQTDMPARYPVAQLGTVSSRIQIPVSRPAFSNSFAGSTSRSMRKKTLPRLVIALCRETGGDDDYIRAEAARRELTLRRERVPEMYRGGLCERKFPLFRSNSDQPSDLTHFW